MKKASSAKIHIHACLRANLLQSSLTLCDPLTVVRQAPLSMRFSKQEY